MLYLLYIIVSWRGGASEHTKLKPVVQPVPLHHGGQEPITVQRHRTHLVSVIQHIIIVFIELTPYGKIFIPQKTLQK